MIDYITRYVVNCSRCDYAASAMVEAVVCDHILEHCVQVHHSTNVIFGATTFKDGGFKESATGEEPN